MAACRHCLRERALFKVLKAGCRARMYFGRSLGQFEEKKEEEKALRFVENGINSEKAQKSLTRVKGPLAPFERTPGKRWGNGKDRLVSNEHYCFHPSAPHSVSNIGAAEAFSWALGHNPGHVTTPTKDTQMSQSSQQAGTHFANLRRMTGCIKSDWLSYTTSAAQRGAARRMEASRHFQNVLGPPELLEPHS